MRGVRPGARTRTAPHRLPAAYDVTRRETFESLTPWLQEVEVYAPGGGRDVVKLLVANKIDKVRGARRRGPGGGGAPCAPPTPLPFLVSHRVAGGRRTRGPSSARRGRRGRGPRACCFWRRAPRRGRVSSRCSRRYCVRCGEALASPRREGRGVGYAVPTPSYVPLPPAPGPGVPSAGRGHIGQPVPEPGAVGGKRRCGGLPQRLLLLAVARLARRMPTRGHPFTRVGRGE